MKWYRADKRDFNVGDEIFSANEFVTLNPEGSKANEDLFELKRPEGKPCRIGCLYLFENEEVARKHWSRMSDGKLYEVELGNEEILHRGDMRFIDEAFILPEIAERELCVTNYWAGIETKNPRVEVLVNKARVTRVISKDQVERLQFLKSWGLVQK